MSQYGFPKKEHLLSRKAIDTLFSGRHKSLTVYPLRAIFQETRDEEVSVRVMVNVSKRHFKHAVDRNRAKRQMREAYRLNKSLLWNALDRQGRQLNVAFMWLSDEPQSTRRVTSSMCRLLREIAAAR
ncbi:MAG: ribonuclease P protein component [Bacteroidaceae bacterium]|nr:ribonuclease P protein component [Bacteroidaceae bacterium]